MSKLCQRLAIVGLGLIGGSFGMALRRADVVGEIIGIDTDPNAREDAVRMGAVHRAAGDLAMGIRQAEVVVIATPVGQIPRVLQAMAAHLAPGALVTDVGSSKGSVFLAAKEALPPGVVFIGGHPMAGSERGGIAADRAFREYSMCSPTPEQRITISRESCWSWSSHRSEAHFHGPWEHDRVVPR